MKKTGRDKIAKTHPRSAKTHATRRGVRAPGDRAVFLDRDGVIIEEVHLLTDPAQIKIRKEAPAVLKLLKQAGFRLIVVTNQTVVARGLISEQDVDKINGLMEDLLVKAGAPRLDGCYFCPHHPSATLPAYRQDCECRKPKPGMLLQASREHALDLSASFMIGDRITDIIAGDRAGCRTVLLETGTHLLPAIETSEPIDGSIKPHFSCSGLEEAARWILKTR